MFNYVFHTQPYIDADFAGQSTSIRARKARRV